MSILITIFLTLTIAWLCYWVMVRPLILDSVSDEIRRLKASVEWAFIEGQPGSASEAAHNLLRTLELGRAARYVSFGQAVFMSFENRSEIRALSAKERATFESAPLWIREIWQRHVRISVKAALANSPAWWIPVALILLASLFSKKVEEWVSEAETAAAKKVLCPV